MVVWEINRRTAAQRRGSVQCGAVQTPGQVTRHMGGGLQQEKWVEGVTERSLSMVGQGPGLLDLAHYPRVALLCLAACHPLSCTPVT